MAVSGTVVTFSEYQSEGRLQLQLHPASSSINWVALLRLASRLKPTRAMGYPASGMAAFAFSLHYCVLFLLFSSGDYFFLLKLFPDEISIAVSRINHFD